MRLVAALFLVVLGLGAMALALFWAMGYPGLVLLAGAMVTAVGLLGIQVDGSDR